MKTIFIQIASYRDYQLIPTVLDCIKNAKYPERLRFGICWQFDEKDNIKYFDTDKRFSIIKVPYTSSKGACWARNNIQQFYNGEDYTFQLDSHHRFIKNWDEELISMMENLQNKGHKKPLLTGYVASFDPDNDPEKRTPEVWGMSFDRFIPEGAIFFLPYNINKELLNEPLPARFYSAHFAFTLGQFCKEVPHDPEYYFHGEEISIAVRAFTHGYDLFHPNKIIAWHEYTRKNRSKHWDDHTNNKTSHDWGQLNKNSHKRNRILFGMDGEDSNQIDFGIYGFGTERTLEDYERYSGISFKHRAIQKYTKDNNVPPNPIIENWDDSLLKIFQHYIDVHRLSLKETDYTFWCVAFHDEDGREIYRQDADELEINRLLMGTDDFIKVYRQFTMEKLPHSWVVWPHSKSKGWCDKIEGKILNE